MMKKFLFTTIAALALAACSGDNNTPEETTKLYTIEVTGGGTASKTEAQAGETITLNPPSIMELGFEFTGWISGQVEIAENKFTMPAQNVVVKTRLNDVRNPYILYLGLGGKLSVGRWGTQVSRSNMLHAKGGSTVGFAIVDNGDEWDAADVKFNPTSTASYATYADILCWNGDNRIVGYLSSSDYNNDENLAAGRGDICKLVGLTAEEARTRIAAGTLDDYQSGFRLPTEEEMQVFMFGDDMQAVGTYWGQNGAIYGGWFPIVDPTKPNSDPAGFLPTTGYRDSSTGVVSDLDDEAYYLLGTPSDEGSACVLFSYDHTDIIADDPGYSSGIRCVKL